jgi:hypothetical protein
MAHDQWWRQPTRAREKQFVYQDARAQEDRETRAPADNIDVGREMREALASRFSVVARGRNNEEAATGVLMPLLPPRE